MTSSDGRGNPYVGPRAYEEGERQVFFGRDQETRQLAALVIAQRAVVLYAPSGAGKTSLLRAGIVPLLKEQKRIAVLPIARVSGNLLPGAATVANIYAYNLLVTVLGADGDSITPGSLTLADGLRPLLEPAPDETRVRPRLLILDQFEELFTTHPERYPERSDFFRQLQECLLRYPQLSVLFSMREDYIAHLDFYAAQMPDRLRTRFRMERLGADAALDAIRLPAADAGIPFAPGVAEGLVDDLRRVQQRQVEPVTTVPGDGRSPVQAVLGMFVEPVHLQIICHQLWERLPEGRTQIVADDVQRFGDVDEALADFYESALARATAGGQIGERQLRRWVDAHLITPARTRGLVYRDEQSGQTEGLPNAVAATLNDAYIIRAEMRSGDTWYELAHDRLVEPILAANQAWLARHPNPVATAYEAYTVAGHGSAHLLHGALLAEAQAYAAANPDELSADEAAFLAESSRVAQQERRRRRNLAIGVIAALAVMAGLTVWALWNAGQAARNAQLAEAQARTARSQALAARAVEQLPLDPEESILLALQAINEESTAEAENALIRAVQTSRVSAYLIGHADSVEDVAYRPDGKEIATVGIDGTLRLWTVDGTESMSLTVSGGEVRAVAYSPDGAAVAVGSEDGRTRVYDTATHALRYETAAADSHTRAIKDIAFSGDGTLLATASGDKEVRIWNAQSGELNQPLPGHTDEVYGIAFAPASKNPPGMLLLASAGLDGRIIIWDVAGGFALREIRWPTPVHDVAFSPDGSFMATGAQDNLVVLWDTARDDVEQWTPLYRLPGHTGWVRKVEFSPDGRTLASSSWDNTARLWDTVAGRTIQSLAGSKGWVYGLAFAPDGRSLVTSSIDGYGRIWNVANEQELMIERAYGVSDDVRVHSLAYSGDGRYLASGGFDNTARLWDAATHELLRPFQHYDVVYDVSLSADGSRLLTASADRSAIVWDTATGDPVAQFLRHNTTVNSGVISRDGTIAVTGGADGETRVWDATSGAELRYWSDCAGQVFGVAMAPDDRRIAIACGDSRIYLRTVDGDERIDLPDEHAAEVTGVAFSPDGRSLVSASKDQTAIVWDLESRQMSQRLSGHANRVHNAAFSPDGTQVATASWDRTTRLWTLAQLGSYRSFSGAADRVIDVAFNPVRGEFATAAYDGAVRFYLLDQEELKQLARRKVVRPLTAAECELVPDGRGCADIDAPR